jgi:zinc/manganese transport system permease protein
MAAQLQFRDVTLGYDRHPAVHHLSGEIAPGALVAVVGPNGAGKSTLFRGIVGILKPLAGSIGLGDLHARDIAYLPQSVDIDRSFPISVFDFVGTGLWRRTGLFGGMGKAEQQRIAQALAAVGLSGFENRGIGTLSGGQMQRMLFARVLLQDARVIVLDEPFNAIDAKTSADLIELVRRWHAEKRTVLAALHDMDLVRANFPETLLLAHRGGLGRDRAGADGGKPVGSAADVRGIRRRGFGLRRRYRALAGGVSVMIQNFLIYDALITPFTEFEFMRRALAGVIALALGGAPIGVFLMLRRMSLVGDAMAHAILPGAAIGFLISGLNLFAMTFGGLIAGFTVAILAGLVARTTELKEDASLATFYLVSLALGVTIVSMRGTNIDLLHVLFGNILAMDDQTLLVIAFNATVTLIVLAVIYRPLVIECVDPVFLRTVSRAGAPAHLAFLALVVINLVNGFHALGTLLAVGLMVLPAGIARFWSRDITGMMMIAVASAMLSGYLGLVLSFQTKVPSGPAIILVAAVFYVFSVLFGSVSGLLRQLFPGRHLEA